MLTFVFVFYVLKYLFYSVFEEQQNLPKMAKETDNFSHFAKHRFIKENRFVATPLLTKYWCFSTWAF